MLQARIKFVNHILDAFHLYLWKYTELKKELTVWKYPLAVCRLELRDILLHSFNHAPNWHTPRPARPTNKSLQASPSPEVHSVLTMKGILQKDFLKWIKYEYIWQFYMT